MLLNSKNWENNIFEIINKITNNIIKIYENSIIVYTLGLSKPFKKSMEEYIIYVKKLNKKNKIDINWIKYAKDNKKFNIIKKLLKIIKIYINENINKTTNKENIYELYDIIKKYKEFTKYNKSLTIRSNSMSL